MMLISLMSTPATTKLTIEMSYTWTCFC